MFIYRSVGLRQVSKFSKVGGGLLLEEYGSYSLVDEESLLVQFPV